MHRYRFSWAFGDPTQLNLLERWADDQAHAFHTATDYVARFGKFMDTAMAGERRFTGYDVVPRQL